VARTKVGSREHVHFYMDGEVFAAIRRIAELKGTTYSELIRLACRQYVIREAEKAVADVNSVKRMKK
jgi:hypothetical protein